MKTVLAKSQNRVWILMQEELGESDLILGVYRSRKYAEDASKRIAKNEPYHKSGLKRVRHNIVSHKIRGK